MTTGRNREGAVLIPTDLGIEFEVTPPYMHWPNAYAEVYMCVMKIATRVRLLQMLCKCIDGVRITDSTGMWPVQHGTCSSGQVHRTAYHN